MSSDFGKGTFTPVVIEKRARVTVSYCQIGDDRPRRSILEQDPNRRSRGADETAARQRLAGPIFHNHEFRTPRWAPSLIETWTTVMETIHINDLFDASRDNAFWVDSDWCHFANELHQKHKRRVPSNTCDIWAR